MVARFGCQAAHRRPRRRDDSFSLTRKHTIATVFVVVARTAEGPTACLRHATAEPARAQPRNRARRARPTQERGMPLTGMGEVVDFEVDRSALSIGGLSDSSVDREHWRVRSPPWPKGGRHWSS